MKIENRMHINAVKREINDLFNELIPKEQASEKDKIISTEKIKGKVFFRRLIDARNKEALQSIAENRIEKFIAANPDNTYKLFFEIEIKKALNRQTYFPNFKTDNKEKEYYFKLERWVECLTELQNQQTEKNNSALILTMQNSNFADAINKIPADKIKDELTVRLRTYKREGGTETEFFNRYQYKKLSVFLHLDINQKDAYHLFFEGLAKPPAAESKTEKQPVEIKPVFKPETIQLIFEILKNYFSKEHQTKLKTILETGNKTGEPLIFIDNGNRLTDTFQKLFEYGFITSCNKQDLINWVTVNFKFRYRNEAKEFIYSTVEKTISRNDNPCKSPLINIEKGLIFKVEQPRKKKYNKH